MLQATDKFLILRPIAKLKNFGFSCVIVGQLYSLKFILVSYFHFEMFEIMADIFLLAAIFVFSLFPFVFLSICSLHFQIRLLSTIYIETFWLKWMFYRDHSCVYFSVAIFIYNLYISLLKLFHCIIAVWYYNKFKSVRIATDTLILWTITPLKTKKSFSLNKLAN